MNRNYIILNGVNSQTIEGLFIKDLPPITKPPMRNTKEEIDGRDGDIITKLGYGAYDKEITIGLANNYDIDEVIAFFTKEATPDIIPSFTHNEIVFSNEPDKVYYFSQLDQIDFNKLIKFRTATVSFHCQPFKYEYDENFISFIPQTTTGTGTDITLTPSSPTKLTLGLKGNTEQDISKNIFQTNGNITYGGITTTDNGDGTLTLSNSASVDIVALQSEQTQAIAAGTYTFSIQEALPFNIYFMFTLSGSMSSATINAGQTSTTFTTQAISKYRLWASGLTVGTTYNQTIKVQLEEGNTPTKWLPYGVPSPTSPSEVKTVTGDNTITITNADSSKSQSYPLNLGTIELCKIGDYQDYIYKQDGKFYKHCEIGKLTVDSSTITARTSYTNIDYAQIPKPTDYSGYNNYYNADYFTYSNFAPFTANPTWDSANNVGKLYTGAVKTAWWIGFTKNTTLDSMKEALGNGVVYYPLATPVEEEITDSNIISQLDAIENANGYSGTTNITSTYFKEPIIIDASIIADNDFIVTNKGNYFSKPSLVIVGSGIIGIYLDGYQIFNIDMGTTESTYGISTKTMEAYKMIGLDSYEIANRQVTGDYSNFKLKSGNNTISFSGNISLILLSQYSRWL